jgi:hypothetical protein
MQPFPLRYPGAMLHWDLPRDAHTQASSLLRLLEIQLADAVTGLDLFEQAINNQVRLTSDCAHAHVGSDGYYQLRLPCIHAHTVLYALDGIRKALDKLTGIPGLPAEITAIRDAYAAAFPALIPVRNSAHHREDRALSLDRNNNPLNLQPVAGQSFSYPAGALILSALTRNTLGYTLDDGAYGEIEISSASVALAQNAIQQAIDAIPWLGPPQIVPY